MVRKGRWAAALAAVAVLVVAVLTALHHTSDQAQPALAFASRTALPPTTSPAVTAKAKKTPATKATTSRQTPTARKTPAARKPSAPKPPATTAVSRTGNDRKVTFVNRTSQKIWVAAAQQTAEPALKTTGWVLPVGATVTIVVPDK